MQVRVNGAFLHADEFGGGLSIDLERTGSVARWDGSFGRHFMTGFI